jgi:Protein of unknown function (DUF1153)
VRKRSETELPPQNTRRWTFRRKAAVLQALRNGVLTFGQAVERYALTVEGIRAWERAFEREGVYGLRALRVYRDDDV